MQAAAAALDLSRPMPMVCYNGALGLRARRYHDLGLELQTGRRTTLLLLTREGPASGQAGLDAEQRGALRDAGAAGRGGRGAASRGGERLARAILRGRHGWLTLLSCRPRSTTPRPFPYPSPVPKPGACCVPERRAPRAHRAVHRPGRHRCAPIRRELRRGPREGAAVQAARDGRRGRRTPRAAARGAAARPRHAGARLAALLRRGPPPAGALRPSAPATTVASALASAVTSALATTTRRLTRARGCASSAPRCARRSRAWSPSATATTTSSSFRRRGLGT